MPSTTPEADDRLDTWEGQPVALCTTEPGDDGSIVEVAGAGYYRQLLALGLAHDAAGGGRQKKTIAPLVYGPAGGQWSGPVTHLAIMSASSGGYARRWLALPIPIPAISFGTITIDANALTIRET